MIGLEKQSRPDLSDDRKSAIPHSFFTEIRPRDSRKSKPCLLITTWILSLLRWTIESHDTRLRPTAEMVSGGSRDEKVGVWALCLSRGLKGWLKIHLMLPTYLIIPVLHVWVLLTSRPTLCSSRALAWRGRRNHAPRKTCCGSAAPRAPFTERINGPRCLFQQHRQSLEPFGGVELAGGG